MRKPDFGERYWVLEHDGGWVLYDKEKRGRRSNYAFVGKFYVSTDKKRYSYNGDYYNSKEELLSAMEKYNSTLPLDMSVYDPVYRKHCAIEFALHDYLTDMGFVNGWNGVGSDYRLKDMYGQDFFAVFFKVEPDTTEGSVCGTVPHSDKWQEASFTDMDSAFGACNSIINTYMLMMNAQSMNILKSLTESRASKVFNKTFDFKSLEVYSEDAKQKTIEFLEKELKRLKN